MSFSGEQGRGAGAAASSAGNLSEEEETREWVTSTGKVRQKHPKTISISFMCGNRNDFSIPDPSAASLVNICFGFSP